MRFTPAFAVLLAAGPLAAAYPARADQPCNPIVDGTYCATQMPKYSGSSGSSTGLRQIDDMSQLVPNSAVGGNQPATLVGISFQGNGRCFGLLRRSACD
jgi:hypothetical protein